MRPLLKRSVWPALYVALAVGFVVLVGKYHHPVFGLTALFQLDASQENVMLPVLKERPVYIYRTAGGYDGMYYAQLATSPLLRDPALPGAIDNLNYRAHRILGSAVSWIIGGGDPLRALDAYALLNPICWFVLAGLLLWVFPPRSLHDAVAWAGILFSAGVLGSVRLALSDLPALVLVAAAVLAVQRGRSGQGVGFLAAAALARETSLLTALFLKGSTRLQNVLRLLAVVMPVAVWWIYVRLIAGPSAPHGLGNIGWPGIAYVGKWHECFSAFLSTDINPLVPWLMLACVIGITVQVGWVLLRRTWENIWWRVAIGQAVLMLCFGHAPWGGYPDAAARVLLPLHLAFNALVPRTKVGLGLLLVGNIGFVSGLDLMLTRHPDPTELAAGRTGGARLIAHAGKGWHNIERKGSRVWCWSGGDSVLRLTGWHQPPNESSRVAFTLRPFVSGTVTITQHDRVLWSGDVSGDGVKVEIDVGRLEPTGTEIRFRSDVAPRAENDSEHARALAFSISDFSFLAAK